MGRGQSGVARLCRVFLLVRLAGELSAKVAVSFGIRLGSYTTQNGYKGYNPLIFRNYE